MSWIHDIDPSWLPLLYIAIALGCTTAIVSALRTVAGAVMHLEGRVMQIEYDLKVYAQTLDSIRSASEATEENTRYLFAEQPIR